MCGCSNKLTSRNAADARVRLDDLRKCASNIANEYTPGLVLVTWEDETLQEVVERVSCSAIDVLGNTYSSSGLPRVYLRSSELLRYRSNRLKTLIRGSPRR
jgi:hypothetical protein